MNYILKHGKISTFAKLIHGGRYHNARDFIKFPKISNKWLEGLPPEPLLHADIEKHRSFFDAIREQDILLHCPYHSSPYTVDLLREAAIDPKVKSISMTLYRVAKNSNIINTLINAIRNGKKVNVLLELKARFDEEANIYWTQKIGRRRCPSNRRSSRFESALQTLFN